MGHFFLVTCCIGSGIQQPTARLRWFNDVFGLWGLSTPSSSSGLFCLHEKLFFFLFLGDNRDPISERKERQWALPRSWLQVLISPLYLSCCFRHHLNKTGEEAGEHFVTPDSNLVWMPQERESWDSAFPLNKKLFLLNFSSLKPVLVFKREGADLPSRRTYTGSKDYLEGVRGGV